MMTERHETQLQQARGKGLLQGNTPESLRNRSFERKSIVLPPRRDRSLFEAKHSWDGHKDIIRNHQIRAQDRRNSLKNKPPQIYHKEGGILWSEQYPPPETSPLLKNKSLHLPSPFTQIVTQQHFLQKRAREFVSVITKEKNESKGRYFLIRQQEEERRKLKTEIEEYEKSMIVGKYREGRRLRAQRKVEMLKERALERQKMKKQRKSQRKMVLEEAYEETDKRQGNKASDRLNQANVTFHPSEKSSKSPKNNSRMNRSSQKSKEVLLHSHQSLKRIDQAKKMLCQLNRLIHRQQALVRQEREFTLG